MKLTNYPLTILLAFGLFAIGCESSRRHQLKDVQPVAVSATVDTAGMKYFQGNLTEAQVDSVWTSRGY
jgi:uncharacterized protein YcfL